MKPSDGNIKWLATELRKAMRSLPGRAGALAVRFVNENFRLQGWQSGAGLLPWPQRKAAQKGSRRALLIKSGRLRRATRYITGSGYVRIVNDTPYAEAHNEGATITGSVTVPEHKRRAHKRGRQSVAEATVKSHDRTVNTKMPRRRFMGPSIAYNRRLDAMINEKLTEIERKWITMK